MTRWVLGLWFLAGVLGVPVGCGGETQEDASRASTRGTSGGGSDARAAAGSGPGMQHVLQARRYDPTRECYWETEPIEGLFAVAGDESTNASMGPVCVISPEGEAYVAIIGTSQAVAKTDSTADWKVPTWSRDNPFYYDYSAFTSNEQALCDEAKTRLFLANYPDSEPITTCTAGAGGPGGSRNAAGTGGAGGAGGSGNSVGDGGSAGVAGSAGMAGEGCIREYDLASYTGSTEGLCPAAEVNHCDSGDRGESIMTACAPDGTVCIQQGSIDAWTEEPDCGWVDCDWNPTPEEEEFCSSIIDKVQNPALLWFCVRDEDCAEPELCVRRVYNRMVCADPNAGGAGGAAGAGGDQS